MTTTMVAAIAAVAVFVVISIITITIVKKESRKRTASIKAIEKSINKLSVDLVENIKLSNDIAMELNADLHYMYEDAVTNINVTPPAETTAPVEMDDMTSQTIESMTAADPGEISLDFLDLDNLENLEIPDDMLFEEELAEPIGEYIVGRSGRRYTAKELEELIKE